MKKHKLTLSDLRVESFQTCKAPAHSYIDDSYTGRYGGDCISLPPNCLQTARKCV
jgi:hypothetical protein